MKFEGIAFHSKTVERFSKLSDWLLYCEDNKHWFAGDPKRIEKLTELYSLVHTDHHFNIDDHEPVSEERADTEPEHGAGD